MIPALALRHWRSLAVGALILAGLAYHWHATSAAYSAGAAAARADVETANRDARDKADAAERGLDTCPAGRWNRRAGRCDQ